MQDMRRNVHDDADTNLPDDSDSSLRACAKVRVEDQQAEELVSELSKEYEEYTRKLSLKDEDCEVVIEDDEEHSHISKGAGLPEDDPSRTEEQSFEIKLSLIERLLRFFGEFYERFMTTGAFEGRNKMLTARERRKKRFILEALIMMLRKFLLRGKALNLKELLDEQIQELRDSLETEQDSEVRKVLQERLAMLLQLRSQLSNSLLASGMERFLMILLGSSLTSATLNSLQYRGIGMMGESTLSYVQAMSRIIDTGDVAIGGAKVDVGSVHDNIKATDWGYQTSVDRCVVDLLPAGVKNVVSKGIVVGRDVNFSGHFAHAEGYVLGTNYVADKLMTFINGTIQNLVHVVLKLARNVIDTARDVVGANAPGIQRGYAANRGQETAGRAAQDTCRVQNERMQNVPTQDFHQQAHVRFMHNRDRTERAENAETHRGNNFRFDYGRTCYGDANVALRCQFVYQERQARGQNASGMNPGNELTDVVISAAVQSQIVAESNQAR